MFSNIFSHSFGSNFKTDPKTGPVLTHLLGLFDNLNPFGEISDLSVRILPIGPYNLGVPQ